MKRTIFTLIFIGTSYFCFGQNELKLKEVKSNELTSPIMLDFLKNFQEKNSIQKIEKGILYSSEPSKIRIQGDKYVKPEIKNIEKMIIVKPNLLAIMRMSIIVPDENTHHTLKIINSDTIKAKPIK